MRIGGRRKRRRALASTTAFERQAGWRAERRAYRIEILPLLAPAVSCVGGGAPGTNSGFAAYACERAMRRVVPCPTGPSTGMAAGGGGAAGAAGATADEFRRVTGMAAPWTGIDC